MPFACCVLSCLSLRVLPSSPRNYNTLYRTISRRPLRCIRAASCGVLLVCPCGVHLYALHRGNVAAACGVLAVYIRGGLVFFSCAKRRVCGGRQNLCIFFGFGVIYKYIYIVTPNPRRYARFAICEQTDVSHANRRHGAACVFAPVHLLHAVHCGGVRKVCLPGGASYIRGTPP